MPRPRGLQPLKCGTVSVDGGDPSKLGAPVHLVPSGGARHHSATVPTEPWSPQRHGPHSAMVLTAPRSPQRHGPHSAMVLTVPPSPQRHGPHCSTEGSWVPLLWAKPALGLHRRGSQRLYGSKWHTGHQRTHSALQQKYSFTCIYLLEWLPLNPPGPKGRKVRRSQGTCSHACMVLGRAWLPKSPSKTLAK